MKTNGKQNGAMLRSRIVGYGEEDPTQLLAHPQNFRRHSGQQLDALRGSLNELGWVKGVIVNKTTGHVLDGHARVEEAMRQGLVTVPIEYVELSEGEEKLALAVLDPITEMATRDQGVLDQLLAEVQTEDPGLTAMLEELQKKSRSGLDESDAEQQMGDLEFRVVVDCSGESQQAELLQRLESEGFKCRALIS